jgi:beta-mannosidase
MTACGIYPVEDYFLKSVDLEVRAQVKRLRNHACLALWCGNNEDLMVAEYRGIKFDFADGEGPWDKTPLPHRIIYMKIWPKIVKELSPDIDYWPTSPWGGKSCQDGTEGDIHQWEGKRFYLDHCTC